MKKFLLLVAFIIATIWLYNHLTGPIAHHEDALGTKKVRVAASVVNLRTGPGTNYNILTVNEDGTGGNWQVKSGSVLTVIDEKDGWYQVYVDESGERTAYIKKSLCADLNARTNTKKGKGTSSRSTSTTTDDSSAPEAPVTPAAPAAPNEEEVNEINNGQNAEDDEVLF